MWFFMNFKKLSNTNTEEKYKKELVEGINNLLVKPQKEWSEGEKILSYEARIVSLFPTILGKLISQKDGKK